MDFQHIMVKNSRVMCHERECQLQQASGARRKVTNQPAAPMMIKSDRTAVIIRLVSGLAKRFAMGSYMSDKIYLVSLTSR